MRRVWCWLVVAAFGAGVLGTWGSPARADKGEKKGEKEKGERVVALEKVPAAARTAILIVAGDNKIEKIEEEAEGGRKVYEAKWEVKDKEVEIKVSADGKLLAREEEISLREAPEPVRKAILKAAGKSKVEEVEKVLAEGKTLYEAEWTADGKEIEIKVAPNGKVLAKEVEEREEHGDKGKGKDKDKSKGEDKRKKEDKEKEEKVTLGKVPAAVRKAILKAAGRHKITEVERETKGGRTVYEAEWKADGKEIEITVSADGKVLKKKADDDDRDDDDDDDDDDN